MKKLFVAIRQGDRSKVESQLDRSPELVNAVAKAPPKKDDGQSALQVAIKCAQFEIATLLLASGADVNYIDRSDVNPWNTPVVHDAIRAAIFSSRFGRNRALPGDPPDVEVINTRADFERAFAVLSELLCAGADVLATDSYGNPAIARAVLDARQVLEPVSDEVIEDLTAVFDALREHGADIGWVDERSGTTLADGFAGEPVSRFQR